MNIDDIRIVLLVAQERNLTRAAERAFLSQPGLSRLVRRVEEAVGTPLFERTAPRWTLTAAGERFCERAAGILTGFDHATAEARAIARDQAPIRRAGGNLTVGALVPAAAELTGRIVDGYRRAFPDSDVTIVDVASSGGERAVTEGYVDAAFLWTPLASDLSTVPLFDDRPLALLGADHVLAARPSVSVDDLADEAFTVTTSMSGRWQAASLLRPWRHHPENAREVPSVNAALASIAAGRAVSIGPRSLERFAASRRLRYVPIDVAGRPTSVFCYRPTERRRQVLGFAAIARDMAQAVGYTVPGAFEPHGERLLGPGPRR